MTFKKTLFPLLFLSAFVSTSLIGCSNSNHSSSQEIKEPNYVVYFGRHQKETYNGNEIETFSYTASGFEVKVNVKTSEYKLNINLLSTLFDGYTEQYINTYVDDVLLEKVELKTGLNTVDSFKNLEVGTHIIRINKLNEAAFSKVGLVDFILDGVELLEHNPSEKKVIEFYGDSITCGFGNLGTQSEQFKMSTEDGMQTYAQLTAERLGWNSSIISYSGIALAMSPFNSPFTLLDKYDTVDGYTKYNFDQYIPDVVVINIGTNDNTKYRQLSGADQEAATDLFLNNYKTLMTNLKTQYPNVKIVCVTNMMVDLHGYLNMCMQGAIQQLNNIYGEFSYYLEFMPNNQGAVGHPSFAAHQKNAETLADYIQTIL